MRQFGQFVVAVMLVFLVSSTTYAGVFDRACDHRKLVLTNTTPMHIYLVGRDIQGDAVVDGLTVGESIAPYSEVSIELVSSSGSQGNVVAFLYFSKDPEGQNTPAKIEVVYNSDWASRMTCYEKVGVIDNDELFITINALHGYRQILFRAKAFGMDLSDYLPHLKIS